MTCVLPQGSVFGSLLLNLYMFPFGQIQECLLKAASQNDYSPIESSCQCFEYITNWIWQNILQLKELSLVRNKNVSCRLTAYLHFRVKEHTFVLQWTQL